MSETLTVAELGAAAAEHLAGLSDSPRLDAEILLGLALGKSRAFLYAWPETVVAAPAQASFAELLERRASGEPMAYILGWREFWSVDLQVTRETLIPRPETERLVEKALELLAPGAEAHVADIGTGTGAIAIAIAIERPSCRVIATDVDPACVAVARANAARLDLSNLAVAHGDLCTPLAGGPSIDLLVCNPPYVAADDPHLGQGDVRAEPRRALVGGADGLAVIRRLAGQAPSYLTGDAHVLIEHGATQGGAVRSILRDAGFRHVETYRDYGGRERLAQAAAPLLE